ncbi:2-C-methyl-D-erythritol 4-phosphate cytidylyltransferase [Flavihumibacter profundi]|jgi:2-C-methyl-D-erythritol 4-phosphate cytidylyltransferase|uniref:2-C-methyl-D-erythritol 4-phosphate cytidylyltransferase n=1 Tax=Flavihumibacter profundi TaxID=2716883 RepID=UPI001CC5372F|nr:2-C-methyl-D-erythritol 4-phosphate cytidylyltransferase [Flavihumibacter profundi]MBZ5855572.1 2-C-methyl-D-erythritol 4-phosphate cytidylyltransferase [Flavihumibacter profundi]
MEKYAVVVAGGSGMRMGTAVPKQFLPLRGKPVLWYTLTAFLDSFPDMQIILVLPEQYLETGKEILRSTYDPNRIWMTIGGETRFHSVRNGLQHIKKHSIIFVHDGVRCLLTPGLIRRCFDGAVDKGNAIPAIKAVDTIRIETVNGNMQIDREKVRIIQTPQTFFSDLIKSAFEQDFHESFTDEASVVEKLGVKINLIEGESSNIKITRPLDLLIAERVLEEREMGL